VDAEFAGVPSSSQYLNQGAVDSAGFAAVHSDGTTEAEPGSVPAGPPGGASVLAEHGGVVPSSGGYRDVGFLIAFVLHLVAVLVLACVYGPPMMYDINHSTPQPSDPSNEPQATSDSLMIGMLVSVHTPTTPCSAYVNTE